MYVTSQRVTQEEGAEVMRCDEVTLLQNIVSFIGLFCKRDLSF